MFTYIVVDHGSSRNGSTGMMQGSEGAMQLMVSRYLVRYLHDPELRELAGEYGERMAYRGQNGASATWCCFHVYNRQKSSESTHVVWDIGVKFAWVVEDWKGGLQGF